MSAHAGGGLGALRVGGAGGGTGAGALLLASAANTGVCVFLATAGKTNCARSSFSSKRFSSADRVSVIMMSSDESGIWMQKGSSSSSSSYSGRRKAGSGHVCALALAQERR